MNLQRLKFSFIDPDSSLFEKAIDLRYKSFFQPFDLSRSLVKDELENISEHLIASYNEEILGYVRINTHDDEALLSQMVVDSSYRKTGIGRELVKKALEKINQKGIKKISLNSRLNTIKFYEKLGFKQVGEVFSSRKTGLLHMKMERTANLPV